MRVPSSALKIIEVQASALPAPKPASAPANVSAANLFVKRNPILCSSRLRRHRGPKIRAKNHASRDRGFRALINLRYDSGPKVQAPACACASCAPLFKHSHLVRALPFAKHVNRRGDAHAVRYQTASRHIPFLADVAPLSSGGRESVGYLGNRNVSTNRAPQAGAPSGRTAQYLPIAATLIGWLPILSTWLTPASTGTVH